MKKAERSLGSDDDKAFKTACERMIVSKEQRQIFRQTRRAFSVFLNKRCQLLLPLFPSVLLKHEAVNKQAPRIPQMSSNRDRNPARVSGKPL